MLSISPTTVFFGRARALENGNVVWVAIVFHSTETAHIVSPPGRLS